MLKLHFGVMLFATMAAADRTFQRPPIYFGGCDYSPLGRDQAYYNCDWYGTKPGQGGQPECEAVIRDQGGCAWPCKRAGRSGESADWNYLAVAENDGQNICRCRCKLK
ncbi:uncharacterized protein SEPMUDRAFT_126267 [Sphaerulina musiva SO2202]|uniref:Uncharacterized protein n=1 Tax=Sphaerulina musiva (strain SO2202) TaxID=692275 RepID=N1QFA5_SPHMS|nr:uncharacterized protein SEPMUDRAFT_126267 [Sphaerulina musiva SO2202]EMF11862.1 hypothetical protein SEPMUDRAFT_126267 [Sphaerulina musiva SO2202]